MRIRSMIIDFKKSGKINREVGRFCIVFNLYFIRIWFVDRDYLSTIKRSHDKGVQEGRQIFKN